MKQLAKWFLVAAFAVVAAGGAQAQRQPGGGMMRAPTPLQVILLTNEVLQKELAVTDDQKKALKEPMDKAAELTKKMQDLRTPGAQPDQAKMQEMLKEMTAFNDEVKTKVDKSLDDKQKKRMKQIEVQMMGMGAFSNEEVVKSLKITDDQKTKFKTVADDFAKERGDLQKEYGMGGRPMQGAARPDPEKVAEYTKKLKTLTGDSFAKAAKELTADQSKNWKEMVGETFDVSKLTQGRPMRRDN